MSGRSLSTFRFLTRVRSLAEQRVVLGFDAIGFILGLGYVMGLRSSMILCTGGVLSNLVLVPLVWMIGGHITNEAIYPGTAPLATMSAAAIFRRAGTDRVADLRRRYPPEKLLPVLYGCSGLVDITTIEETVRRQSMGA